MFAEITHLKIIRETRNFINFLLCLCLVPVIACNSEHTNNSTNTESSTDATELYKKGVEALDKQDYGQAMTLFIKASDMGNAEAMNDLGVMYSEGIGVTQNYLKTRVRDNDIQLSDITVRHELSGGQSLVA